MTYSSTIIQKANAPLSYPDILGLYLGLSRFVGEENSSFLQRLYRASNSIKDTSVKGIIDTISLNLNLGIHQAISITGPVGAAILLVPGILILNSTKIPLFHLADDTYLEWLKLSDVVLLINQIPGWTAILLIDDTSALTLCKYTNLNITLNEVVISTNLKYNVINSGLIIDSLLFNFTPPAFTITGDVISFESNPPTGLTLSYQNIINPFILISSEVNLIGLTEPNLVAAATSSNNVLGYQLREAIQKIMSIDRSYWSV